MQWCPQYLRWTLGVLTWTLALAWGLPQVADAQPTMSETMSGKKREHLELLRMWRLVDKLEIDEEQAMSVFPAFHRQRTERETLEKRRRSLLAVVTRQLKEEVADDDLLASISELLFIPLDRFEKPLQCPRRSLELQGDRLSRFAVQIR